MLVKYLSVGYVDDSEANRGTLYGSVLLHRIGLWEGSICACSTLDDVNW